MKSWLAKYGFDYSRFRFGTRTAIAACLALIIAWALGLEHPQWSAMTVWGVSQPTRGLLLEKAGYRSLGTLIGTTMGIVIVTLAGDNVLIAATGLTVWVTLCVYGAHLLHGLISYGAVLAGYSSSMVVLLSRTPDALLPLGIDRLITVLLGVMIALVVGWLFTYRRAEQTLVNKVRRQTAETLRTIARAYDQGSIDKIPLHDQITNLAHLETQLADHGSGSPSAHLSAKLLRRLINSQLGLLAQLETCSVKHREGLAEALRESAQALTGSDVALVRETLAKTRKLMTDTTLEHEFRDFIDAIEDRIQFRESGTTAKSKTDFSVLLHRDWRGAKQASIRTFAVMLLISFVWSYTGWFQLAYLLLGASVMLTLFSTVENPAKTMYYVFLGQTAAAIVAVTIQAFIWPQVDSVLAMLLCLMPVILVAGLPLSHNKTSPGAMDFNIVFLLLMQPYTEYHFETEVSLGIASAVVAAPLLAMASYKLVFPTNIRSRQRHLLKALDRELEELEARRLTANQLKRYRARFYHRLLRLYQMADRLGFNDKLTAARYLIRVQQQLNRYK
ncbi:hypothetical protein CWI71_09660 [Pseudidiomarina insulisalsae]|uniref:FUSC family protein n=1 Tax=Pseudidiomarina insulisalsae TaxID=575789 RepID=A0A432YDL6_9GAMM|nr:hypothetical protein CWI71_09660 [Pseudidiomarina insulisalsae]